MKQPQYIEQDLIGALVLNPLSRQEIFDLTDANHFPNTKPVYLEACRQHSEFGDLTPQTVAQKVENITASELEEWGQASISEGIAFSDDKIKLYCALLEEEYSYTNIERSTLELHHEAKGRVTSVSELLTKVGELTRQETGLIKSLTPSQIFEREETQPRKEKLISGERKLDEVFFEDVGFHRGDVMAVTADSGHGKTQFAMMIERLLISRYKGLHIQLEDYDVNTATYITQNNPEFMDNLFICDSLNDIDDIKREARRIHQEEGLDFLVLDYIQIAKCRSQGSKTLDMEYICGACKDMAKELNIVVIVTSQVTIDKMRSGWSREPRADDAKWAQAIKEMSHCIVSVFRPNALTDEKLIAFVDGQAYIKDWNSPAKLLDYRSVFAKVVKQRRGQLTHNRLHMIHNGDYGLQVVSGV